jgi:hypothetical protein
LNANTDNATKKSVSSSSIARRHFLSLGGTALLGAFALTNCTQAPQNSENTTGSTTGNTLEASLPPLPPAAPDPQSEFGVDLNINMSTIDNYLNRPDVFYRDMRMLTDTARFDEIGGDPELSFTLPAFRIIPFPYIGTLPQLPVEGRYEGDVLYVVQWNDDLSIRTAIPKYLQAQQILEEVFPQDQNIFLMCGGGGYAAFMKKLLVFLGWNESRIYNIGGAWDYEGPEFIDLVLYDANDTPYYYYWRAMYTIIDFSHYTLTAGPENGAQSKNPEGLKKQSKHCQW